jgi:hypothetical protein
LKPNKITFTFELASKKAGTTFQTEKNGRKSKEQTVSTKKKETKKSLLKILSLTLKKIKWKMLFPS